MRTSFRDTIQGTARPELSAGLRCIHFKRYVMFYTVSQNGVRIERILHGARDIPAAFKEQD
nr:type II toxin-antitoxin system RelE/ParE family toxin [Rhizobium sp. CFBP 13726]